MNWHWRKLVFVACVTLVALLASRGSSDPGKGSVRNLFGEGAVTLIKISASRDAIESLRNQPRHRVKAQVQFASEGPFPAEIRLKGHGSFQAIHEKPSFTVDFDSDFFPGLSRIHLNNAVEDSTYIQEHLGSEIFRSFGIAAPRVAHARVKLNGRDLGLYVLKEGFTRDFLEHHFGSGVVEETDKERSISKTLAEEQDLDVRWEKLKTAVAVEDFVSFMAAEVLIAHWDGYSTAGHNFRLFVSPKDGKYHFLPIGMDQLFGNARYPAFPDMTGTMARAFMETSQGRELYAIRLQEFSRRFDSREWVARAKELGKRLRPALTLREYRAVNQSLRELSERIVARDEYLEVQVSNHVLAGIK